MYVLITQNRQVLRIDVTGEQDGQARKTRTSNFLKMRDYSIHHFECDEVEG